MFSERAKRRSRDATGLLGRVSLSQEGVPPVVLLALLGPVCGMIGWFWLADQQAILGSIMLFAAGGILYLTFQDIAPQSRHPANVETPAPINGISFPTCAASRSASGTPGIGRISSFISACHFAKNAALVHGSRALGEQRSTSWPSWQRHVQDLDMQSSVHSKNKTKYHVWNSALICYTTHFSILLYHCRLPTTTRPDRADTEEKGRTGSDPPLFAALSANRAWVWGRGCYRVWGIPCPPLMGVASVQFIPAGRPSRVDLQYPVTAEAERRLSAWARPVRRMATPLCRVDCLDPRS